MTNIQEKHWQKLFGFLTTEPTSMYGVWSVYSPEKEVLKSSQGIRTLVANADFTIITHINQFPSPDNSIPDRQWQIEKETCNLPDGLLHPADPSKRALALTDYGASAWVPKQLESGRSFSVELFLKHEDWNSSIGSIYAENGNLEKILHLREHLGSFPEIHTAPEITHLSGNWIGIKESISADLKLSASEEISELILDPTKGKNKTFFLPDSVVVNIPEKVQVGEALTIAAAKLFTKNKYKRLTAEYNSSGVFTLLTSEVFSLQ